jgi:hypothetical protein
MDKYLREYDEIEAAKVEVEKLISSGDLKAAELAVERYEPSYRNKWSVGRFGYTAHMEIGQAYLDKGLANEALRLFKSARPGGGCGNCMASQHIQRNIRVARIYESRLNFPAAFSAYLDALPSTTYGGNIVGVVFGLSRSGAAIAVPVLALAYLARKAMKRCKRPPTTAADTEPSPPKLMSQPDGPANRSQPVSPQTNPSSAAAGSDR